VYYVNIGKMNSTGLVKKERGDLVAKIVEIDRILEYVGVNFRKPVYCNN